MKLMIIGILLPIIGLVIGFSVRRLFKKARQLRLIDYLPPFFVTGIQLISLGHGQLSIIEILFLIVLIIAILLALYLAIQKHELLLPKFFKILWRLIFILSFCWYIGLLVTLLVLKFIH